MLVTPHSLVGLAIIHQIPNLWGLFLAFLSHFILDFFMPHWNPHLYTELNKKGGVSQQSMAIILVDGVLGAGLTLYFMSLQLPDLGMALVYGLGSLLAILPDAIEIPYYFLKAKTKWLKAYVHFEHQHQANAPFFWGVLTQLIISLAALKVLWG